MNKYEITEATLNGATYLYAETATQAFGDYAFMFPEAPVAGINVKLLEEVGA